MNRLHLIRSNESAAEVLRNVLQGLRGIQPHQQSPERVTELLTDVEATVMRALNMIEPPPTPGVPEFSGRSVPQADGAA